MRTTKVLECAMARALFASANLCRGLSLKDGLMLQIISTEGSMANNLLTDWLNEEKLHELQDRIAGEGVAVCNDDCAEIFYRNYALQLSQRFGEDVRITTTHAMIDILSDKTTRASQILPQYGITITLLTTWLMHFSGDREAI